MRRIMLLLSFFLMAFVLGAEKQPSASAQEPDDQFQARMRAIQEQKASLQKQLEDLAKKEQALREEMAERAKEKEYYIKVEVKGRLLKGKVWDVRMLAEREGWTIASQQLDWELDFSKKKKLLETAKQCEGKSVLIVGTLVPRETTVHSSIKFLPMHALMVETLKAAE